MSPASSESRIAEPTYAARAGAGRTLLLVYRLGRRQASSARAAFASGSDVACLSADQAVLASLGGNVRVVGPAALPGFEDGAFVEGAFDLVEEAVEELVRRRPALVRSLRSLVGSPDVDRYLCRSLLRETGGFLATLLLIARSFASDYSVVTLERSWPNGLDHAFLASVARRSAGALPPQIRDALERTSFAAERTPRLRRQATAILGAARELGGLWRESLRLVRPLAPALPHRPLLLRSYDEDWGLDIGGQRRLRNLDFFVDGELIRADDVGVWAEVGVPPDRDPELKRRGYAVYRQAALRIGVRSLLAQVLPLLFRAAVVFVRTAFAERWWQLSVRRLLSELVVWGEVARQVRPRVLLALNDIHPSGVARTLALRKAACLTVEYEFSSHWLTDENGWVPDYVYGFTVVDAMVSWGPLHSRHFANHRGAIGDFWELGCLWSEHAALVREDSKVNEFYRRALADACHLSLSDFEAVVAVFDTSTASFFTYDDMAAFYAGVAELAARFPRVLFLCKPKRPVERVFIEGAGGTAVRAALAAAGNVAVLPERFETAAVVGLCDLSINACFTSPAVETIGAGRPALYYDPTDLFPSSFFRQIPGFVATDADELGRRVEELLSATDAEREHDLRTRFSDLEGHFDGLAITRLRERLHSAIRS